MKFTVIDKRTKEKYSVSDISKKDFQKCKPLSDSKLKEIKDADKKEEKVELTEEEVKSLKDFIKSIPDLLELLKAKDDKEPLMEKDGEDEDVDVDVDIDVDKDEDDEEEIEEEEEIDEDEDDGFEDSNKIHDSAVSIQRNRVVAQSTIEHEEEVSESWSNYYKNQLNK